MLKSSYIKPGHLEVFCGPMNAGKSKALIDKVDTFEHLQGCNFLIIKPNIDNRGDKKLWSRFASKSFECVFVDETKPKKIFDILTKELHVLIIDEAHFFHDDIIKVIEKLLRQNIYIIVGGLDLDFRGEPFGAMPKILSLANKIHKLKGVCEHPGCLEPATRTQRLINGFPAPYNSPIILIGDDEEGYECRCIKHHIVPKRTLQTYLNEK